MNTKSPGIAGLYTMIAVLMILVASNGCLTGVVLFGVGAATAVAIDQGFIEDDTYAGRIQSTLARTYDAAVEVMDELCPKIVLERPICRVSGSWKGSDVYVSVESTGDEGVFLRVKARRYMLADRDTAEEMFQRILTRINGP